MVGVVGDAEESVTGVTDDGPRRCDPCRARQGSGAMAGSAPGPDADRHTGRREPPPGRNEGLPFEAVGAAVAASLVLWVVLALLAWAVLG